MARTGGPGTIRGDAAALAAAQGITQTQAEYRIRVQRAAARGITPSVSAGKPKRGELTLTEQRQGIKLRRSEQPAKYRQWWVDDQGQIKASIDTNRRPDVQLGDRAYPDSRYPSRYLTLQGITVAR